MSTAGACWKRCSWLCLSLTAPEHPGSSPSSQTMAPKPGTFLRLSWSRCGPQQRPALPQGLGVNPRWPEVWDWEERLNLLVSG